MEEVKQVYKKDTVGYWLDQIKEEPFRSNCLRMAKLNNNINNHATCISGAINRCCNWCGTVPEFETTYWTQGYNYYVLIERGEDLEKRTNVRV